MEYVSIWMRIGWALWFISSIIALLVRPIVFKISPKGMSEVKATYARSRRRSVFLLVASIIFIILLIPEVAPYVVTKDTRWAFMIVPWLSLGVQIIRIIGRRRDI